MKVLILFSLLMMLLAGCSDDQDLQREEEFGGDNTEYDQGDIHSGNDVLPDDLDTGVSK